MRKQKDSLKSLEIRSSAMTLGQALGFLKAEHDAEYSQDWHELSESERNYQELLRKRLKSIRANEKALEIFAGIPGEQCSRVKPHFADNEDFFLALFFINPQNGHCLRLSKHLNKCLSCFEIFSQVMRDYYQEYHELIKL